MVRWTRSVGATRSLDARCVPSPATAIGIMWRAPPPRPSRLRNAPMRNPDRQPGKLPSTGTRGPLLVAAMLSALCFGGLGAWSALAPLESASLAPGVVVVDSSRKTVAHLEGGVIAEILVREHDQVEAGQVLIRLDPTMARAAHDLYRGELMASEALIARLTAEREG